MTVFLKPLSGIEDIVYLHLIAEILFLLRPFLFFILDPLIEFGLSVQCKTLYFIILIASDGFCLFGDTFFSGVRNSLITLLSAFSTIVWILGKYLGICKVRIYLPSMNRPRPLPVFGATSPYFFARKAVFSLYKSVKIREK